MKKIASILTMLTLVSCSAVPEAGVSHILASERKNDLSDIVYSLYFEIPDKPDEPVSARESIILNSTSGRDIILDFRSDEPALLSLAVNGTETDARIENEHIAVPAKYLSKGKNTIDVSFVAGGQSMNRREEFLYTLLVPDRARTLFPCFDQPDLKATYELTLNLPSSWVAVSNSPVLSEKAASQGRKEISFHPTEALSTYLFSFVCGKFDKYSAERDGRTISLYHRETDPDKIGQCDGILQEIFDALEYMQEYTAMPYPFAKYDCIAIPDFQFGGMEHTGATLYNDRSLFLDPSPTTGQIQNRSSLIAHETAHMWFGDCVTMKWFNDVWTKEVFANWFAARIIRPRFPDINYTVSDLYNLYASAYSEDRTIGSNAIQRPLDNLDKAGLIYCNIIYDKAPIVMEMLKERLGEDLFRDGIRKYLQKYKYSNATWDDLIDVLSESADFDIKEWSRVWVKEKGMPEYDAEGRCIDPFGNGNVWEQEIGYLQTCEGVKLPNPGGKAYGCFIIDENTASCIYRNFFSLDEVARMSFAVNLFENVWRGYISAGNYINWISENFSNEKNPLIYETLLDGGLAACNFCPGCAAVFERASYAALADPHLPRQRRIPALRTLCASARSEDICQKLFEIWSDGKMSDGLEPGEWDMTRLAYRLMLCLPDRYDEIRIRQRERIENPDRIESFDYICRAVSPDADERKALFESFSTPAGRKPESRVLTALGLLCDPTRGDEALSYIRPALDLLEEVRREGDIFFPSSWCRKLLSGQNSRQAAETVRNYLNENPDIDPLLRTKVEQAAARLLRDNDKFDAIIPHPQEIIPLYGHVKVKRNKVVYIRDERMEAETYEIRAGAEGLEIKASDQNGFQYAETTIRQLLGIGISEKLPAEFTMPMCIIKDGPRYGYRGLMLDCCRHFFDVGEIKRVLDIMAFYKLNRFHWHLTEDQAWRMEIAGYPQLTAAADYYTREDMESVVDYAAARGISVIPEFEVPGHSLAALSAIPYLGCTGGPYKRAESWGVFEDVMCPGKESTFEFIKDIIGEMSEIFPSQYIHIGGDECPKTRWSDCPDCRSRMAAEGLVDGGGFTAEQRLQSYFTERVQKIASGYSKKIIGWEEILEGNLCSDATVISWSGTDAGIKAAAKGIQVVMAPAAFCYFDHCQVNTDISDPADAALEPESNEYFLPLEWCYEYEPTNGFAEGTDGNIAGVEACMWTEYAEDPKKLEYMLLPRLAAESEVQWCLKGTRSYDRFFNALKSYHFPVYDKGDYMYCRVSEGVNGYWK